MRGDRNEKDDRIGRFERFKRLRNRQTNRPTDVHDLLYKCEDALKNMKGWIMDGKFESSSTIKIWSTCI